MIDKQIRSLNAPYSAPRFLTKDNYEPHDIDF